MPDVKIDGSRDSASDTSGHTALVIKSKLPIPCWKQVRNSVSHGVEASDPLLGTGANLEGCVGTTHLKS